MASFVICLEWNLVGFWWKKKIELFTINIPVDNHNKTKGIPIDKKTIWYKLKSDWLRMVNVNKEIYTISNT